MNLGGSRVAADRVLARLGWHLKQWEPAETACAPPDNTLAALAARRLGARGTG